MIKRDLQAELQQMAREYPIVTVMGPRQSGKTTLVKAAFPSKPYLNMESPENRQLAEVDPNGLLAEYPDGAIFDEIQRVPELLSYLQVIVDEKKQAGQFILTGSHQLHLHEKISQSLAGRTAILTLLPLTLMELASFTNIDNENEILLNGLLPRIYNENQQPTKAYRNYLHTYIERDVRQLIHIKDLSSFQKFLTICASRIGQLINYDNIACEVGVSNNTIKNWLSILEASYIIFRLQPYYANINKQVVKTPKLYFTEPGLAAYLLGIETTQQMQRDPLRGQLFENLIVLELIKFRYNKGLDHRLFFYRDNQKHEVDVIFQQASELIPIEIKSSKTFHTQFMKELDYFAKLFPDKCRQGYIIYAGNSEQKLAWKQLLNFRHIQQIFH